MILTGAVALAGCSSSGGSPGSDSMKGTIQVSAASSLTEAFGRIGQDFQKANPGATVTFNFGSSGTLATQILQGAPADAFASADPDSVGTVQQAGLATVR